MAAGIWVVRWRPQWLGGHVGPPANAPALMLGVQMLAVLGRWSLPDYLLHQPVMIGVLMAIGAFK